MQTKRQTFRQTARRGSLTRAAVVLGPQYHVRGRYMVPAITEILSHTGRLPILILIITLYSRNRTMFIIHWYRYIVLCPL